MDKNPWLDSMGLLVIKVHIWCGRSIGCGSSRGAEHSIWIPIPVQSIIQYY